MRLNVCFWFAVWKPNRFKWMDSNLIKPSLVSLVSDNKILFELKLAVFNARSLRNRFNQCKSVVGLSRGKQSVWIRKKRHYVNLNIDFSGIVSYDSYAVRYYWHRLKSTKHSSSEPVLLLHGKIESINMRQICGIAIYRYFRQPLVIYPFKNSLVAVNSWRKIIDSHIYCAMLRCFTIKCVLFE